MTFQHRRQSLHEFANPFCVSSPRDPGPTMGQNGSSSSSIPVARVTASPCRLGAACILHQNLLERCAEDLRRAAWNTVSKCTTGCHCHSGQVRKMEFNGIYGNCWCGGDAIRSDLLAWILSGGISDPMNVLRFAWICCADSSGIPSSCAAAFGCTCGCFATLVKKSRGSFEQDSEVWPFDIILYFIILLHLDSSWFIMIMSIPWFPDLHPARSTKATVDWRWGYSRVQNDDSLVFNKWCNVYAT